MKGERERPHVSDRGLDGKSANKKEPMERLSVPCLRTVSTVGSDTNIQGVTACWCRRNSPIRDAPSLQQIPTCRTFCFKNLGFLSSRLVRAPGKKAHRLMTPHLWSTLQVGGLDHSHAFWNYSCEMFGGVAW